MLPFAGFEQMAQNQWAAALRKLGHQVAIHFFRAPGVDPVADLPHLISRVTGHPPEVLFMEGASGFGVGSERAEFFRHPDILRIPIVVFWFDDPLRPLEYRRRQPGYLETLRLPNVRHLVWDGYWRKWLADHYQTRSFPFHLAADPDEFQPRPPAREFQDHAVFIGTLISPRHIEEQRQQLPPVLQRIATEVAAAIRSAPYAMQPYEILEATIRGLPAKVGSAFSLIAEKDPEAALRLRSITWKLGKNEVRQRVLREALKVTPVLMLAGNFEQTHAVESEVRGLLGGNSKNLVVRDTRDVTESRLGELYAYGRIHIQATDPQSVAGGIPFRVFQTTAARRPLLTDRKPELAECFVYEEELLTFHSDADFADALDAAMRDAARLEQIARRGHERFLKEHTWKHRFDQVMTTVHGS